MKLCARPARRRAGSRRSLLRFRREATLGEDPLADGVEGNGPQILAPLAQGERPGLRLLAAHDGEVGVSHAPGRADLRPELVRTQIAGHPDPAAPEDVD